jgi:tetratricopeptide (TPR) repeat protein
MRFAALGFPEGTEWPLPIIEHMLADVSASVLEPVQQGAAVQADLEAFVAYSLVGLVPAGGDAGRGTAPRVRLHPLVRELAREKWAQLPALEQEAVLHGLLAGAHAWLAQHQSLGLSPADIETLASDEQLIAGAVREAVVRHIDLPQVIAIAEAWGDYLYARNLPLEREMAGLQLEAARRIGDRPAEVEALRKLARASDLAGQHDVATAYRQEALAIARGAGDQLAVLNLLCLLGETAAKRDVREEAEWRYEEASAIAREMGDRVTDSRTLSNLGALAKAMGRFEEAERWYQHALESDRTAGNVLNEAITQTLLGFLYEQTGDIAAAQRVYEDLLPRGRAYGHRWGIGMVLNALGQLALRTGDLETAERDLTEALPYMEQSGATALGVQVRGNLTMLAGLQAQRRGDREAAMQGFAEALRLFDQNGPEQGGVVATDQRPFVRQLLAELHDQPAGNAPAGTPGAAISPTLRVRRRWWPWDR